jgi:Tol biopolymer transport system component
MAGTAGAASSSSEQRAGAKTRIVWTENLGTGKKTRGRIVSARPDGSDRHAVTHPPGHVQDIDAQISPDGGTVAFGREPFEGDTFDLLLIDADGLNEREPDFGCTDPCAGDTAPSWSLSGDRLFFSPVIGPFDGPGGSAHSAVLYGAEPEGGDIQRLSEPGIDGVYEDYHAHYSPDGSYIVFVRVRNDPFNIAVFRMNADGSDVRQLTPWKLGADLADISQATGGPTKDLIVFETYGSGPPKGNSQNVGTVPATCASVSDCKPQIEYLTGYKGGSVQAFNPSWSPNGRKVAYTKFKPGDKDTPFVGDIYTMRADGTHRKPVTTKPTFEFRPDWGTAPAG